MGGFCGTGKARQGRVNSLGLASLNNFGRLWAIEVVPSCLVSGCGIIKTGEYWPGLCQGEEVSLD